MIDYSLFIVAVFKELETFRIIMELLYNFLFNYLLSCFEFVNLIYFYILVKVWLSFKVINFWEGDTQYHSQCYKLITSPLLSNIKCTLNSAFPPTIANKSIRPNLFEQPQNFEPTVSQVAHDRDTMLLL